MFNKVRHRRVLTKTTYLSWIFETLCPPRRDEVEKGRDVSAKQARSEDRRMNLCLANTRVY